MCACKPASPCDYHNSKKWSQNRRDKWNSYQRERYQAKRMAALHKDDDSPPRRTTPASPPAESFISTPLPWEHDHRKYEGEDIEDVRELGGYAYYSEGDVLYHGSPVNMEVGTVILPDTRTGFAYATPDVDVAEGFSAPVSNKDGITLTSGQEINAQTGERYIYEVEPIEPEKTFHIGFGKKGDYTTKSTVFAMNTEEELIGGGDKIETISPAGYQIIGKRKLAD